MNKNGLNAYLKLVVTIDWGEWVTLVVYANRNCFLLPTDCMPPFGLKAWWFTDKTPTLVSGQHKLCFVHEQVSVLSNFNMIFNLARNHRLLILSENIFHKIRYHISSTTYLKKRIHYRWLGGTIECQLVSDLGFGGRNSTGETFFFAFYFLAAHKIWEAGNVASRLK